MKIELKNLAEIAEHFDRMSEASRQLARVTKRNASAHHTGEAAGWRNAATFVRMVAKNMEDKKPSAHDIGEEQ